MKSFPVFEMTRTRQIAPAFAAILLASAVGSAAGPDAGPAGAFQLPEETDVLLDRYCYSCHDEETQKGDTRLDNLSGLDTSKRLDLLNRMQEQVYFQHMPPKKKRQPAEDERAAILAMISAELKVHQASTLEDKLQKPEFGNYIDHEKLFSGEFKDLPGFTYDRRWLISEYIFNAKFQRLLENGTQAKRNQQKITLAGGNRIQNLSLTNPFLLPNVSGVRYYANEDLTGGHLSSMLTNAQKTSEYITDDLVKRRGSKYLPAINEIMALEDRHHATLASRRGFLESHIAKVCAEIYGGKNESLLPAFTPVVLKPIETLAAGEKYKKAPFHVAQNMLKGLEGDVTVYQFLLDPQHGKKSDDEFRELCERTWFYFGDHERKIQGRMTILRDYLPELRDLVRKDSRKIKPACPDTARRVRDEGDPGVDPEASQARRSLHRDHRQMHGRMGAGIRTGARRRRASLGRTPCRSHRPALRANSRTVSRSGGSRGISGALKILCGQTGQAQGRPEAHSNLHPLQ